MDPSQPAPALRGDVDRGGAHLGTGRSGGEGSGVYLSEDGGDTWRKLEGNGLPLLPVGKTDMCV